MEGRAMHGHIVMAGCPPAWVATAIVSGEASLREVYGEDFACVQRNT